MLRRLLDRVGEIRVLDVLEVRLVDDGKHVVGDGLEEAEHVVALRHRPRRVVDRRQERELRPLRHGGQHRVGVHAPVMERDPHGHGAELQRIEDVARERGPRRDDLVADVERRLAREPDHGVRARRDDDLLERDTVTPRERVAQAVAPAVRVPVRLGQDPRDRVERLREGAERALVRCELDDPLEAELPLDRLCRLARLVRDETVERRADELRPGSDEPAHAVAGGASGAGVAVAGAGGTGDRTSVVRREPRLRLLRLRRELAPDHEGPRDDADERERTQHGADPVSLGARSGRDAGQRRGRSTAHPPAREPPADGPVERVSPVAHAPTLSDSNRSEIFCRPDAPRRRSVTPIRVLPAASEEGGSRARAQRAPPPSAPRRASGAARRRRRSSRSSTPRRARRPPRRSGRSRAGRR